AERHVRARPIAPCGSKQATNLIAWNWGNAALVPAVAARYHPGHVYAVSARWLRPALPAYQSPRTAIWRGVAARNQARRLPRDGSARTATACGSTAALATISPTVFP